MIDWGLGGVFCVSFAFPTIALLTGVDMVGGVIQQINGWRHLLLHLSALAPTAWLLNSSATRGPAARSCARRPPLKYSRGKAVAAGEGISCSRCRLSCAVAGRQGEFMKEQPPGNE
jgi:hypothetical protein